MVFIPPRPREACEHRGCRCDVADAAKQILPRSRWRAREACDLQSAKHHARRRPTKNREQREVLQVNDGKCRYIDEWVELGGGKMAAERAEQGREPPGGEERASGVDYGGDAAIFHRSDGIQAVVLDVARILGFA